MSDDGDVKEWVPVGIFFSQTHAELIKLALHTDGIETATPGLERQGYVGATGGYPILVKPDALTRAKEVIKRVETENPTHDLDEQALSAEHVEAPLDPLPIPPVLLFVVLGLGLWLAGYLNANIRTVVRIVIAIVIAVELVRYAERAAWSKKKR